MASGFRRLVADHASLHNSELPPNYFFAPAGSHSSIPDDLRQLTILLTGPQETPYAQGLWRLHLRMPEDYPKNPPKATFKTRIWHPNVDESTGAVCVDTLKRDWEASLTLRDVLITISCLLIHPNPDSALNSAAGALLQDDYETFARQAKLLTSIHAPIPAELRDVAFQAKRRGEDPSLSIKINKEFTLPLQPKRDATRPSAVVMKKKKTMTSIRREVDSKFDIDVTSEIWQESPPIYHQETESDDEAEDPASASKENDPSLSPSPVTLPPPPSPRRSVLGKRPLAALDTPQPAEVLIIDEPEEDDGNGADNRFRHDLSASERNVVANSHAPKTLSDQYLFPFQRKSPKLSSAGRRPSASSAQTHTLPRHKPRPVPHHGASCATRPSPPPPPPAQIPFASSSLRISKPSCQDLKENMVACSPAAEPASSTASSIRNPHHLCGSEPLQPSASCSSSGSLCPPSLPRNPTQTPSTMRNSSNSSNSSSARAKPRIGLRRL
ncbi:hypothetical protein LOZ65_004051 [Ophidiomyces ophidiicola]|nr:hypothetical protein LOZ65_004051 [Ophidiomyces ophidiicola]